MSVLNKVHDHWMLVGEKLEPRGLFQEQPSERAPTDEMEGASHILITEFDELDDSEEECGI